MAAIAKSLAPVLIFTAFCCYACFIPSLASSDDFIDCLSASIPDQLVFTQSSPSFTSVLVSSIRNPRFFTPTTVRPLWMVTPTNASHVQAAVVCGRRHGVRLRVRSGGHDYEGLSYRSQRPEVFAVLDLSNLRAVRVDKESSTVWVDSGATLGELYYAIWQASNQLAFPAGLCPTIGVGGHFSGGGFGTLLRKYGLAVDNVLDAVLVDAKGRLLDKNAMGSDVFWAIRGGGGESFGIVLSWQVRLVSVPPTVTAFRIPVTVDEGAMDVVTRWQEVAPALPDDLFIRALIQNQSVTFESLYLGTCDALLPVMSRRFPELGMNRTHCQEMTWIQTVPYFFLGSGATVEDILNRTTPLTTYTKMTSDYVRQAIHRDAWEDIFTWLTRPGAGIMILDPYGAAISSVPEAATPFPHRAGVLYNIQYVNFWFTGGDSGAPQLEWIRDLFAFMEPYVSSDPREAYFNYRDLDLGENVVVGNLSSYEAGKVWGEKYFKDNYQRLAVAKDEIDPDDYFRNEQSIPPLGPGN
ncbi:Tetrahydrocannabinolic acid synthase [Dichanthelium oligosanthes]|uniref:Tetrahydrocannabinolic acid synthase n=1 Tax=Dichanthelium oligosanthes TaxID=888268 RepID=A0A1E5WHZ8_9POAL|nr:Tetrahydrocannabinolic acid synthase [Dichanthelium oligosanthes]